MSPEEFMISELAMKAGVSIRTIRYYIDQGLLPAPTTRGRYAQFTREHLHRLELIKKLKSIHLPLEEIRQILDATAEAEIPGLMDRLDQPERNMISVSADTPADEPGKAALDYLSDITSKRSMVQAITPQVHRFTPSLMARVREISEEEPAADAWMRIQLSPGVELNYQTPTDPESKRRIGELIKFAQKLFRKD